MEIYVCRVNFQWKIFGAKPFIHDGMQKNAACPLILKLFCQIFQLLTKCIYLKELCEKQPEKQIESETIHN